MNARLVLELTDESGLEGRVTWEFDTGDEEQKRRVADTAKALILGLGPKTLNLQYHPLDMPMVSLKNHNVILIEEMR